MNRTRWLIAGLTVALVVSLGFSAWLSTALVDKASMTDDLIMGQARRKETISTLRWIADRYGRYPARDQVKAQMDVRFPEPGHVVKWEGDILWVDEVGLQYVGDSLQAIVLMNEVK